MLITEVKHKTMWDKVYYLYLVLYINLIISDRTSNKKKKKNTNRSINNI